MLAGIMGTLNGENMLEVSTTVLIVVKYWKFELLAKGMKAMTDQPTMEERFALLEARVAELEQQRRAQEDRDIALLARIDNFIDDLHRIERVQMRSFEELKSNQQELKAGQRKLEVGQEELRAGQKNLEVGQHNLENAFTDAVGTLKNHKEAIEAVAGRIEVVVSQVSELAAGQQQIITLLSGKPPLHD